jgi:CRP/FNR family transcriptional regulator, anaerobic regulatory protein
MTANYLSLLQQRFVHVLTSLIPLPDDILAFILQHAYLRNIPKNTLLPSPWQMPNTLYFVGQGLARGFYEDHERDVTSWFAKEDDFIYSPRSILTQNPTPETIQTLEDTHLLAIDLQAVFATYPTTYQIQSNITAHYLKQYNEQVRDLRGLTADQRLRKFIEQCPALYERVPHKYVASYLGITPETMSRILKRKN